MVTGFAPLPMNAQATKRSGLSLARNSSLRGPMMRFALLLPPAVLATDSATNQAVGATPTETFVASVVSGNLFEIESSKLALDRTKSDRIKGFANRMIDDHGVAAIKFRQAVNDANLTPPPEKLDAKHQAVFDDLKAKDAGTFDKAYIDAQYTVHVETIDLFKAYVRGGDHWRIRQFADELLRTLHAHLDQVKKMR
jgi:putative membrane protein